MLYKKYVDGKDEIKFFVDDKLDINWDVTTLRNPLKKCHSSKFKKIKKDWEKVKDYVKQSKEEKENLQQFVNLLRLPLNPRQRREIERQRGNKGSSKQNKKVRIGLPDDLKHILKPQKGASRIADRLKDGIGKLSLVNKKKSNEMLNIQDIRNISTDFPAGIKQEVLSIIENQQQEFGKKRKRKSKFGEVEIDEIDKNKLIHVLPKVKKTFNQLCSLKKHTNNDILKINSLKDFAKELDYQLECKLESNIAKSSNITSVSELVNHINIEIKEISNNTDAVHKKIENMINKLKTKDKEIFNLKNQIEQLETTSKLKNKALEDGKRLEIETLRETLGKQVREYELRLSDMGVYITRREEEWEKKVSNLEKFIEQLREKNKTNLDKQKQKGENTITNYINDFERHVTNLKNEHRAELKDINKKLQNEVQQAKKDSIRKKDEYNRNLDNLAYNLTKELKKETAKREKEKKEFEKELKQIDKENEIKIKELSDGFQIFLSDTTRNWNKEKENLEKKQQATIETINTKMKEKLVKLDTWCKEEKGKVEKQKNKAIEAIKNLKINNEKKLEKVKAVVVEYRNKVGELNKETKIKQQKTIESLQEVVKNQQQKIQNEKKIKQESHDSLLKVKAKQLMEEKQRIKAEGEMLKKNKQELEKKRIAGLKKVNEDTKNNFKKLEDRERQFKKDIKLKEEKERQEQAKKLRQETQANKELEERKRQDEKQIKLKEEKLMQKQIQEEKEAARNLEEQKRKLKEEQRKLNQTIKKEEKSPEPNIFENMANSVLKTVQDGFESLRTDTMDAKGYLKEVCAGSSEEECKKIKEELPQMKKIAQEIIKNANVKGNKTLPAAFGSTTIKLSKEEWDKIREAVERKKKPDKLIDNVSKFIKENINKPRKRRKKKKKKKKKVKKKKVKKKKPCTNTTKVVKDVKNIIKTAKKLKKAVK